MADTTGTITNSQTSSLTALPPQIPAPHLFRAVEKWDCQRTSEIPQEVVDAVLDLHRPFARNLARSLGVYLRAVVEVETVAGLQASYREVESSLTGAALAIALRPESHVLPVVVVVDPKIASPCLDLLLGGSAENPLERAELTDVDVQILSELSEMISRELQNAWRDIDLRLHPEVSLGKAARRIIPTVGNALRIDFTVKLGENTGRLSLLLATPLVDTILQTLNVPIQAQDTASSPAIGKEFGDALSAVSVPVELVLPPMRVSIGDLMQLAPNHVLTLPLRAGHPAQVVVAGREIFSALPVRSGRWRAAKIEHPILKANSSHERPELQ